MSEIEIDWTKYNKEFVNMVKAVYIAQDINFLDKDGNTILMYASLFGYLDMVKLILEENPDVNLGNITPLLACIGRNVISHIALNTLSSSSLDLNDDESKYEEIVKILIENGADVNAYIMGLHILTLSALSGSKKEMELLFQKPSNLDFTGDLWLEIVLLTVRKGSSNNPLNTFTGKGTKSMIELLINNGANVNYQDKDGYTAYEHLKDTNKYDIIKLLLDNGADISLQPYKADRTIAELEKLKKNKGIRNDKYKGLLRLDDILKTRNIEKLKLLANQGVDFSTIDILKLIRDEYSIEFIEIILKNGGNIDMQNDDGIFGLMLATLNRDIKLVKVFIECKANINMQTKNLTTSLMIATLQADIKIIKILLKNGAKIDINSSNQGMYNAFDMAIDSENIEIIKLFLSYMVNDEKNYPHELVKILTNFTVDKPMKYTTHSWDFGLLKDKYENFAGYMDDVKQQWDIIKNDLEELSPNLYKKVYNFLWETDSTIALGWSSIDGLKKWCNDGNDPFEYKVDGRIFKDIVNTFKNEIEIRRDNNILENIFIQERKKLGRKFKVELVKLKGKTFYTDVEYLKNALAKIFSEIQKRPEYSNILVETIEEENGKYLDIMITHKDSKANVDAKTMLKEVNEGDFADIKHNLINLCDWCIESSYENSSYRVNYLRSNNVPEIEELDYQVTDFKHILRFYGK